MRNSLFIIALMIVYVGLAKVFHWPAESLWGLAILFAASTFLILREAFPNYFGVLNARAHVIQFQLQTIKRKNLEIEKMKLSLREMHEELRGVHALWMKSKSVNSSVFPKKVTISAQATKTIESILATQNWNLMTANAELSDEERADIASRIIQQVLPISNFRNYSMEDDGSRHVVAKEVIEQKDRFENLLQETFVIENAMFESAPSENAIIDDLSLKKTTFDDLTSDHHLADANAFENGFVENESFEMTASQLIEKVSRPFNHFNKIDNN